MHTQCLLGKGTVFFFTLRPRPVHLPSLPCRSSCRSRSRPFREPPPLAGTGVNVPHSESSCRLTPVGPYPALLHRPVSIPGAHFPDCCERGVTVGSLRHNKDPKLTLPLRRQAARLGSARASALQACNEENTAIREPVIGVTNQAMPGRGEPRFYFFSITLKKYSFR